MQNNIRSIIACAVASAAATLLAPSAHAFSIVSQTFQQGVGGYTSEISRSFASNTTTVTNRGDVKGTAPAAAGVSVDGYNTTDSSDQPIFMTFANLFGSGAGQIPVGAFIIDASLTLTTASQNATNNSSANSGGAFAVSASLVSWNTTSSTYNNLKPQGSELNGLSFVNGIITRPVAMFDDPTIYYGGAGSLNFDGHYTANVAPLVRAWANGSITNNGFVINNGWNITGGTADAWQVKAENHTTVADRPKLSVTYTTSPVITSTFRQGVGGYTGTTMSWMRLEDDRVDDASTVDHGFLDGWQGNANIEEDSSDDHALIKFNNLFQGSGGSIPKTARIVKATLLLTTTTVSNAQTGQVYEAHQMLRSWDTSTTWTDFGSNGIVTGVDEGPALTANYDMVPNSESYFDITSAVDAWRTGQNNGIDVRATAPNPLWSGSTAPGTTDGWSIYFTGATDPTLRPLLSISYILRLPGDANEDGVIGPDDFALTDRGFAKHLSTWNDGDFNVDGVVDAADYLILDSAYYAQIHHAPDAAFLAEREAEFGEAYVDALLASVPEPSCLALAGVAAGFVAGRRRRS